MMLFNKFWPERLMDISLDFDLRKFHSLEFDETNGPKISLTLHRVIINYLNRKRTGNKDLFPQRLTQAEEQFLVDICSRDRPTWILQSLIAPYYRTSEKSIYVIQKEFFERFSSVNLDCLQYRHIPKKMVGFVQLPIPISDGEDLFDWFHFFCGDGKEIWNEVFGPTPGFVNPYPTDGNIVGMGYMDVTGRMSSYVWLYRPLDENMLIRDSFKNTPSVVLNGRTLEHERQIEADGYKPHVAMLYNLLAYLQSGSPDIRDFRNAIRYRSPTSTKPVRADGNLSRENIVLVGYNWMKDRSHHVDEWGVMPYMRWQRCGAGLSDVKLVLVRAHTRRWQDQSDVSKIDNTDLASSPILRPSDVK